MRNATLPIEPVSEARSAFRLRPVRGAEPLGQVIAFANQKGGVAKTTTTLNLGVALAERGKRVLTVDLDPQSNLTMSQGIDPEELEVDVRRPRAQDADRGHHHA